MNTLFLLLLAYLFGGKASPPPAPPAGTPLPNVPPPFPPPGPIVVPGPIPGVPSVPGVPQAAPPAPSGPIPAGFATYVIQSGDNPSMLAKKFTGDGSRWKEWLPPNPKLKVVQTRDETGKILATHVQPFNAGQVLNVPPNWPPTPTFT